MSDSLRIALGLVATGLVGLRGFAEPTWIIHDRERPQPAVVDPGAPATGDQPGRPPSDAIVLFDGKDASHWVAMNGGPTTWIVRDGAFECVPHSGSARTLESFGDCQLHIEWSAPVPPHGDGQGRGNSGVFFGFDRYELQVLDSNENKTYADGSAGAVYGQFPPLVNAARPPGQWQSYDIVWTAPRFGDDGRLAAKARMTVFQNGVLVQNNVGLKGPTGWIGRLPYKAHPERLPISLQDHENPVRFRNIWVRELGNPRHKEFLLPDAVLDGFTGDYGNGSLTVQIRRLPDGLLSLSLVGQETVMHAESPTRFFGLTTDVRCEFSPPGKATRVEVTVGDDGHPMVFERVGR